MRVTIGYGLERVDYEVSEASLVAARRQPSSPPIADLGRAVHDALEIPIGFPALRKALTPDDYVETRTCETPHRDGQRIGPVGEGGTVNAAIESTAGYFRGSLSPQDCVECGTRHGLHHRAGHGLEAVAGGRGEQRSNHASTSEAISSTASRSRSIDHDSARMATYTAVNDR